MAKAKKQESRAIQKAPTEQSLTPFSLARRFMDEMDRLSEDFGFGRGVLSTLEREFPIGAWAPQVEMFERDGQLVLRADLPGLSKDDVKVELKDNAITIEGERRSEHEEKGEDYYRSERSYGNFYRRLPLPEGVKADNATATFDNGVLEITMPVLKREEPKARKLEIAGESKPKSHAKAAGK
jgi:HSP20 family protein